MLARATAACCAALFLGGCAAPAVVGASRAEAAAWGSERGFAALPLEVPSTAPPFRLFSLLRQRADASRLTIYIEGDGAAWPSPYRPPRDPTPYSPSTLLLAERDPAPVVAWLARPCQYPDAVAVPCDSRYWTDARYAGEVLAAMDAAVDALKARSGARRLGLVGYSGGGVVAALLATRRSDVDELITVAAPLALAEWTATQELTPLAASLDPLAQRALPAALAATHFAGGRDQLVPPTLVARYAQARGGSLLVVDGFDHECCWTRDWLQLLQRARKATNDGGEHR